ncbi:MAG TPA: ABC transporter permease subunit [Dongiaceae bacterium]|nr:ABC transporter permease subunit [Dongiaceae bacterium]
MTDVAIRLRAVPRLPFWLLWLALGIVCVVLWIHPGPFHWAVDYPKAMVLPITKWVGVAMKWLVDNFRPFTRAIASLLDLPLSAAFALLAKGFVVDNVVVFPRLSWLGVVGAFVIAGYATGGRRVAAITAVCFLYIALFGQWDQAMLTLALVVICIPLGVIFGTLFGIVSYRVPWLDTWVIRPSLDLAQTVPAFAYLVPILLLFGSGPVPGLIATVIFAAPPMVRATKLALERVPEEIESFADMAGCTRRQKLWRVMIPTAQPLLMVGVNQVIMMTLNMVIIASMIGAGGLGFDVLLALRALKIGVGLEAGIAIVAIAIALDRISAAAATRRPSRKPPPGANFLQRRPYLSLAVGWLAATTLAGLGVPWLSAVPKEWTLTTAPVWDALVAWINIHFHDAIEVCKVWLLVHVLNPFRNFLTGLPWLVFVAAAALLGFQLGGRRIAMLAGLMLLFPAVVGLWEKTMMSVYLCAISALIACLIGIPLGAWGARNENVNKALTVIVDTLQTLPGFVYLMPAVMLVGVGDVAALLAIVLFAVTMAIRYTTHGIRHVPPHLIEAARAMGCTPRQIYWRVQLPLAMPEIMLGINQTVLMSLAMLIITALIGTRDLGQEVFISLAKADGGRGIVAGLIVAFLGIVADRLIVTGARRLRRRLGLPESEA